ncbi:MAG: exodeoxyribonuclease VII large subunit [Clostridia bacterium]|nr:exodeoxyribonuclease VII large subunit [Clostridia bacterium]
MKEGSGLPALTVTDVNRYIKSLLKQDEVLSAVAIRGEISNFKAHSSGHLYFTLKDEGAELSAVMFRGDAVRMGFRPADGMRVVAYGSIDVYEKSGRVQLYVRTMVADGIGAMMMAYERLKEALTREGLFAPERKKPLPKFPQCVGVITAPTGAAIRDILNITGRRYPQANILIYPSLVQGAEAPENLCAGLAYLNAAEACDVIILGRGGGSMEDLWAFNDEALVRAVADSVIPVISAVGHETDFTLCDFAADCRAPTPSAAAELALPDRGVLAAWVKQADERIEKSVLQLVNYAHKQLTERERALTYLSPDGRLERVRQTLSQKTESLTNSLEAIFHREEARFDTALQKLHALSPLATLRRGYSAVRDGEGRVVSSVTKLYQGETVRLLLRDGEADANILAIYEESDQGGSV